jgi:BMFP domain-containing protein YqiC
MLEPKLLDDLAKRFSQALPPGFRQLQGELEKNFRAALHTAFSKLDLVTREEFDVQQSVLARTRARLEDLERQVAGLEAQILKNTAASEPQRNEQE